MSGLGSNNWGPSVHRGPYSGDNEKGCWLWTGITVGRMGYGKVTVNGAVKRAHREVFAAVYGWEPPVVRHRCDEPLCWRPDHLDGGTVRDNTDDKVRRGRQQRGERCYNAVVNDELVRRIRALRDQGRTIAAVAGAVDVTSATVQAITSGRSWSHVLATTDGSRSVTEVA